MPNLPRSADAIVVGGGIVGAAAARALARAGMAPLLLEARAFGGAVTGASLAAIGTHMHGMEEFALLDAGCRLWSDLAEDLENPFEYSLSGQLRFVLHEADIAVARSWVERETQAGADCRLISAQEARELEPLMTGPLLAATWAPATATVNPFLALRSVLASARQNGATAHQDVPVEGLILSDGRVTGVQTRGGPIATPHVVLAGGPWTARLAAMAGVALPMRPRQAQCLASVRRPPGTIRRVISACERAGGVDSGYTQIQQAASGQILFNTVTAPVDATDGVQDGVHEVPLGFVAESIDTLLVLFPALAGIALLRSWARFEAVTPDSRFYAGPTPVPGLHVAAGDNGSGFCRALMLAEVVADGVTGQSLLPAARLREAARLYDPMRFAPEGRA